MITEINLIDIYMAQTWLRDSIGAAIAGKRGIYSTRAYRYNGRGRKHGTYTESIRNKSIL